MSKYYLGIDPGRHGGFAIIDQSATVVEYGIIPYNGDLFSPRDFAKRLNKYKDELICTFEHVFGMPNQSSVATFTFGKTTGEQICVLKMLKIPFFEVSPIEWKKNVLKGLPWKAQTIKFKAPKGTPKDVIARLKSEFKKENTSRNNLAKKKAKEASTTFVLKMFPEVDLYMGKKNAHDGIADAVCIAYYGYMKDRGQTLSD